MHATVPFRGVRGAPFSKRITQTVTANRSWNCHFWRSRPFPPPRNPIPRCISDASAKSASLRLISLPLSLIKTRQQVCQAKPDLPSPCPSPRIIYLRARLLLGWFVAFFISFKFLNFLFVLISFKFLNFLSVLISFKFLNFLWVS